MGFSEVKEYLPFLIPLVVVQFTLMVVALTHILRHRQYRVGSRAFWIVVVVLFQLVGSICYFAFGKGDE